MFETFVVAELISHIETAGERTELFHLKDRDGREVDAVLERAGRVVGIEVKPSGSADRKAARVLIWLRDQLGESLHLGVVLYSGAHPFQLDDRIWALPISSLWHACSLQRGDSAPTHSVRSARVRVRSLAACCSDMPAVRSVSALPFGPSSRQRSVRTCCRVGVSSKLSG